MDPLLDEPSDEELLATYAAGSEAAFADIVRRHGEMVLAASRRLVGRSADADDIAQDVFVALAAALRAGKPVERLPGWLRVTARHVASHHRDAAAARRRHEAAAALAAERDRAGAAADAGEDMRRALTEALAEIGDRYRAVVIRHYLERISLDEIARELGAPIGTVGWWLARGRSLLRDRLARRGFSLAQVAGAGLIAPGALEPAPALGLHWIRAAHRANDAVAGSQPAAAQAVPGWMLSLAVHGLLALVATTAVMSRLGVREPNAARLGMQLPVVAVATDSADADGDGNASGPTVELGAAMDPTAAEAPALEVAVEDAREAIDDWHLDVPATAETGAADGATRGESLFLAIGGGGAGGGGSGGMYSLRQGSARARALGRFGGSRASEHAVEAALRWFRRHQAADGAWRVAGYQNECPGPGQKCEPGIVHAGPEGDIACTAYAVLCYLGAGYDHRTPSRYRAAVANALEWLVAQQRDGSWSGGVSLYSHGVATMAVAEAYAMSNDPALREPAQRAVDLILARQTQEPARANRDPIAGLGWDYNGRNPTRIDASVTGWQVMALKSAASAGLDVRNGLLGADRWLERAWKAGNPGWERLTDPATAQSVLDYGWNPTTDAVSGNRTLAPVGALCAAFLGHHQGDPMLESLCNWIGENQTPTRWPTNLYYLYYGTLAVFQAGGPRWQRWNRSVRDLLVNVQRRSDDCVDGSWDAPGYDFGVGTLLSTAYCCLSLEVYYRYLPVGAGAARAGGDVARAGR